MHDKKKLLFAALLASAAAPALASASQDLSQLFDKLWSPTRLGPLECRAGLLNSSPLLLPRCMQAQNTQQHLQMLHDIALANGGTDEGPPGPRGDGFYAAYFRDPDGNKLNAFVMGPGAAE